MLLALLTGLTRLSWLLSSIMVIQSLNFAPLLTVITSMWGVRRFQHNGEDSMSPKERYQQLKAIGVCVHCREAPARLNRVACQLCADQLRVLELKAKERCKTAGICVKCCDRPAQADQTRCKLCAKVGNARVLITQWNHRKEGLCRSCPRPAVPGKVQCVDCLNRHRIQESARKVLLKAG